MRCRDASGQHKAWSPKLLSGKNVLKDLVCSCLGQQSAYLIIPQEGRFANLTQGQFAIQLLRLNLDHVCREKMLSRPHENITGQK